MTHYAIDHLQTSEDQPLTCLLRFIAHPSGAFIWEWFWPQEGSSADTWHGPEPIDKEPPYDHTPYDYEAQPF
jgi:hypothetical protein